jgi:superfamily II DNA/RNA helicase
VNKLQGLLLFSAPSEWAAIVLVPARELAMQTSAIAKELGLHLKLQVRRLAQQT